MEIIEVLKIIGICLFSYLIGSIPFGYIVSKHIKGVNIQKVGSGNIGGTNIGRVLGWRYGFLVAGLDIFKGALPVITAIYFLMVSWWLVGLVFVFCMLGAIFPVWLRFKGGKGVSVLIGGLLVLLGWQVWLIVMICWFLVFIFFVRRRMSMASLILASSVLFLMLIIPVLLYMMPILIIIVFLIWWAHRENIQKILRDEEPSTKLPYPLNKLPDDLISWVIEKLQLLLEKLQNLQKKPEEK